MARPERAVYWTGVSVAVLGSALTLLGVLDSLGAIEFGWHDHNGGPSATLFGLFLIALSRRAFAFSSNLAMRKDGSS
jgi:hypothetical protein